MKPDEGGVSQVSMRVSNGMRCSMSSLEYAIARRVFSRTAIRSAAVNPPSLLQPFRPPVCCSGGESRLAHTNPGAPKTIAFFKPSKDLQELLRSLLLL